MGDEPKLPPATESLILHLAFAEEFVVPVLNGEKTATVRYPPRRNISVGDVIIAETSGGDEFARLEIQRVATVNAVEAVPVIETLGAKYGSETADELVESLNGYYDKDIRLGTSVQVIVFERVDSD